MIAQPTDDYFRIDNFYINKEKVLLDDKIFVTSDFKIDLVMLDKYGVQNGMKYLPLVLSFNGIGDITNIEEHTIFNIPNLESLLKNTIELTEQGLNVGVVSNVPSSRIGTQKQQPPSTTKLKLQQTPVTYNPNAGTITY